MPLKTWLAQDATDRHLIDQLRERVNDDTLPDGLLAQAEDLLGRDHELTAEEPALAQLGTALKGPKTRAGAQAVDRSWYRSDRRGCIRGACWVGFEATDRGHYGKQYGPETT